jgi:uncharacterized MAPEG superfamily protein
MTADVTMMIYSAILALVMFLVPGMFRAKGWTPAGFLLLPGNRDNLPEHTPASGRADRAAKNMIEAMVLFVPLVAAARALNLPDEATALGAQVFFFARLVYFPVYVIGIPGLRTALWLASLVGLAMMLRAVL